MSRMVEVKVKLYGILAEMAGRREHRLRMPVEISLHDLLHRIMEELPGLFKASQYNINIIVLRNGKPMGERITLNDGDVIDLLPPASGG